jgi:hypothetical protein
VGEGLCTPPPPPRWTWELNQSLSSFVTEWSLPLLVRPPPLILATSPASQLHAPSSPLAFGSGSSSVAAASRGTANLAVCRHDRFRRRRTCRPSPRQVEASSIFASARGAAPSAALSPPPIARRRPSRSRTWIVVLGWNLTRTRPCSMQHQRTRPSGNR